MNQQPHCFDELILRRGTDARKYDPTLCPDEVIPMWIADTDFKAPQLLIDRMLERVSQGHFGYPYNSTAFCEAVSYWMKERFGWEANPDWVEFAPGAILPAVYTIRALSAPGDKVLIQTPAYPPFYQLIENNGRRVVKNPMLLQNGRYEIDFTQLEKGLSDPRTRIMLLCNPHNPTGRSFTRDELEQIGNLCLKHHVFVIADEIHNDILYKGRKHLPFCSINEQFSQNSLIAINPSKTFNTAGLRTAAFLCPNKRIRDLILEQRLNNKAFGRPIFGQLSVEVLYRECGDYATSLVRYLEDNVALVRSSLENPKLPIRLIEPEATYLLWLDCRAMGLSQKELVRFFTEKARLLLNDGETFGEEGIGFMRMNIACPRSTVTEARNRLLDALRKWDNN